MYPILFTIGSFSLSSLALFILLSWGVWSFLFWRHLKSCAATDPKIFDVMFLVTVWGFAVSRIEYVVFHLHQFSPNWLRIFTLWIQPGLSLYWALIVGIVISIILYKQLKIRIGDIFDAWALSFLPAFAVGSIGSFLDGGIFGIPTSLPWAVRFVGIEGLRHPIGLYSILAIVLIFLLLTFFKKQKKLENYFNCPGSQAVVLGMLFSLSMFLIEILTQRTVYWKLVSANQIVLILLFGQCLGALFVSKGIHHRIAGFTVVVKTVLWQKIGGFYGRISKRIARKHSQTS